MPAIDRRLLQNFDWTLLGLAGILATLGLVNLFSATHQPEGLSDEMRRQLIALGVGLTAAVIVTMIDYRHYERFALPLFVGSLGLLALTLLIAPVTRGSRSWLFGGRVQPAEFAKIALVLALARYFHRNPPGDTSRLRDLFWPGVIVALPVGMILGQRDMGVALLTLLIASTYLPLVRIPWRAWAGVAVAAVAALVALWNFSLAPYQKERILTVIDPGRDPLASGYQMNQSRIAIGSGGLFGTGYMQGTQTQLRFLPTQHTDFAFSVVAEEWGFAGSCVVLGLYATLLFWGLVVARSSKDDFGALLAIGVVGCLFWPAVLNVAMVLGLAPVIGVPLPLFSYGGSAMVTTLASIGLLMNVSMRRYVF
ncbi:MAG TPA: rod shape-determining protein RodA [Myxococcota bacterium]|nr:rod shape-determining protein RodA [Myxococcota bacterium]